MPAARTPPSPPPSRFFARHAIDPAGLEVATEYTLGGRPARVSDITIRITPPPTLPDERREALLAVASHCTVHNTLADPPAVGITLDLQNQR